MLSECLQNALCDELGDGMGSEWVGALFLEIVSLIGFSSGAFTNDIKYPDTLDGAAVHALRHEPSECAKTLECFATSMGVKQLSVPNPDFASSVTQAWDLLSLLIKPVRRLFLYLSLLARILEQMPDEHFVNENLRRARDKMEEVARAMNEDRRRAEVVKEILTGDTKKNKLILQSRKIFSTGRRTQGGI